MKFARYLDDNATTEWKRAYIDYKKLKKCIKAVAARKKAEDSGNTLDPKFSGGSSDDKDNGDDDDDDSSDKDDHGPHAIPKPKAVKLGEGSRPRFWNLRRGLSGGVALDGDKKDEEIGGGGLVASPVAEPRSPGILKGSNDRPWDPSQTPRPDYGSTGQTPTPKQTQSRNISTSNLPPLDLPDASAPVDPLQDIVEADRIQPGSSFDSNNGLASGGHTSADSGSDINAPPTAHLLKERPRARWQEGLIEETTSERPSPDTFRPAGRREGSLPRSTRSSFIGRSPRLKAAIGSMKGGFELGPEPPVREPRTPSRAPSSRRSSQAPSAPEVRYPHDLTELYDMLVPDETKFFTTLDSELNKVESFYHDRLTDAVRRGKELKIQLAELQEHRRVFHEAEDKADKFKLPSSVGKIVPNNVQRRLPFFSRVSHQGDDHKQEQGNGRATSPTGVEKRRTSKDRLRRSSSFQGFDQFKIGDAGPSSGPPARPPIPKTIHQSWIREHHFERESTEFDPEKYQRYKRNLKVAVLEYYKELEILKNYRILNLTGFKKALKKFEKTAKLRCLDLYMKGKVSKQSFSNASTIDDLLKEVEDEYTLCFEHGNHKKAVGKLRGQTSHSSHHYSAFMSGMYIGLGFPGFVLGLTKSFSEETRVAIPQYDGLLQVYATLFLPVLFGILFQINLTAFVRARINYIFIMEIDARTALDYRAFMQIPALLFLVLSWCFYFSFERVGYPQISPFAWPIVWMVFAAAFFINPIPIYYQHARYWFISVLGRVLTPGYSRVEFIAFFVGDLINSLVYSVGNLWFIGCTYHAGWPADRNIFEVCPSGPNWVYAVLLVIPALLRLVQCLKRYKDSRLNIHLINAGKYASVMLQYGLFSHWRSKGSLIHDKSFPVWATFATISSLYTCSWDLFVDWGLLRPKYGFLRESLGYPNQRWLYYVAMVVNVLLRFVWVWYIPNSTQRVRVRSFAFATLEVIRRWIWIFYRVETEQVGNTDQYRVSREVPLPYRLVNDDSDDDDLKRTSTRNSAEKVGKRKSISLQGAAVRLGNLRQRVINGVMDKKNVDGTGPGARGPPGTLNAGPRGDFTHRDYERRISTGDEVTTPMPRDPNEDSD